MTDTLTDDAAGVLIGGDIALSLSVGPGADTELQVQLRGRDVLPGIRLGLEIDGVAFGRDSELVSWTAESVRDAFTMRTGKAAGLHEARHEQATVVLRDRSTGREWGVVLRVAEDGAAFRYRLPADSAVVELGRETTLFAVPAGSRVWPLEYQTYYETPRFGAEIAELADGDYGFPFLVRGPDGICVLLTESAIDGRFAGAHAVVSAADATGGRPLGIITADPVLDTPGGTVLPWRVLVVGGFDTVVASNLVDELAPAADPGLAAAPWIRPGRAAWSWWSAPYSPSDPGAQRRFIDFAAAHAWEYVLIDAGWEDAWAPDVIDYARSRGVGVFLWSHWEELPASAVSEAKLALWKSWGAAGVKVDFMESESRERYRWYDWILAETARLELMVNFHGSVIPRGWARTFPHVMSYEGIRGAEYYIMAMPSPTAAHNVIQPFTRNVAGSMDYTPVTFGPRARDRETSDAHELALAIAFESGVTHFADDVGEYDARPIVAAVLDALPTAWDETRLLSGTPDTEAVVARRSGSDWFVGCIAVGEPRTITVHPGQLIAGDYEAWIVEDAASDAGVVETRRRADADEPIAIDIRSNGGFVAVLRPASVG